MDRKATEAEFTRINERLGELNQELLQCKDRRDKVQKKRIKKEIMELEKRAKKIGFALGWYRYPEDKSVEYEPGKFINENIYRWLMKD